MSENYEIDLKESVRSIAQKFSEGWHEGIEIDATDIMELLQAANLIESLEAENAALKADHEKAVALVIESSIATGNADTSADLMAEVLHKVGELRAENAALREALQSIVDCTPANKHEVWPHHHHYLVTARNALAPPTTDKGE